MSGSFARSVSLALSLLLAACTMPQTNSNGASVASGGIVQDTLSSIGKMFNTNALSGVSGNSQGGKMVAINGLNIMIDGPHPTDPRWQGKTISETPLYHFFDKHPRSAPGQYFPRVAIRIDDYSDSLTTANTGPDVQYLVHAGDSQPNIARPAECLRMTAVIWTTPKQSQRIENIVHCNEDIRMTDSLMSLGALNSYRAVTSPFSMSSEQVRTFGPKSPSILLPVLTQADAKLYATGQFLFSSLFAQMGYRGGLDGDPRVWFVNLSKNSI